MAVKIIAQRIYSDAIVPGPSQLRKSCKIRTGPKWDGKPVRRL